MSVMYPEPSLDEFTNEEKELAQIISPYHPDYYNTIHNSYLVMYHMAARRAIKWMNERKNED